MWDPPAGFDDMLGDAELAPDNPHYHPIDVPDVGTVIARRPMPNAIPALAMSVNAKIDNLAQQNYLTLFVRNHLADGEHERILAAQMTGDLPITAIGKVARAIATWGTARPTLPSSASR